MLLETFHLLRQVRHMTLLPLKVSLKFDHKGNVSCLLRIKNISRLKPLVWRLGVSLKVFFDDLWLILSVWPVQFCPSTSQTTVFIVTVLFMSTSAKGQRSQTGTIRGHNPVCSVCNRQAVDQHASIMFLLNSPHPNPNSNPKFVCYTLWTAWYTVRGHWSPSFWLKYGPEAAVFISSYDSQRCKN